MEEHQVIISDRWVIRLGKEDGEFDPWHLEGTSATIDFYAFEQALELKRTLAAIDNRMKERAYEIRQERKEENKKARQEALAIKCIHADTYKGIQRPRCNKGNPCQSCLTRYAERQAARTETNRTNRTSWTGQSTGGTLTYKGEE